MLKRDRLKEFWEENSFVIPNVFRYLREIEEDSQNLLEFQDLSKKVVLVQETGTPFKPGEKSLNSNGAPIPTQKVPISKMRHSQATLKEGRRTFHTGR